MAEARALSIVNYIIIHEKLPSISDHMARRAAAPIIASIDNNAMTIIILQNLPCGSAVTFI
jgi:hypothetical protein